MLAGKKIVHIGSGNNHCLVVTQHGDIYSCGMKSFGLGEQEDECEEQLTFRATKYLTLHRVLSGVKVVVAEGGIDFSIVLSEKGNLWSFGTNCDGQLGIGSDEMIHPVPRIVFDLHKINVLQVACGGAHSLITSDSGIVYSWGQGSHGKLGHGDTENRTSPERIRAFAGTIITFVCCGWSHCLCIDQECRLWSFGKSSEGQLGLGIGPVLSSDVLVPTLVRAFQEPPVKVVYASAGFAHSVVLAGNRREVFTFGLNEHGELGLGNLESIFEPHPVQALYGIRIESVACGGYHTLALSSEGQCYSWGDCRHGQLGLAVNTPNVCVPTRIERFEGLCIKQISAGFWHSMALGSPSNARNIGDIPRISSVESVLSMDEDLTGLNDALKSGELPSPGPGSPAGKDKEEQEPNKQDSGGLVVSPFGRTVSGVLIRKPPPARDTSMKPQQHSGQSPRARTSSISLNPKNSPLKKVSSFLSELFKLEEGVDNDEARQEAHLVAGMEKSEIHWRNKVLPEWDTMKKRGKLQPLIFKGIPPPVRGDVWRRCVGNELNITEEDFHKAKQEALKDRLLQDNILNMIKVDLPRTFPKLQVFQDVGPFYNELSEVLEAFAVYHKKLGYVQGMSFIAGMFLLHMDQFDTFVCLNNLLSSHFFESLFLFDIKECLKHIRIYELLFSKHLPQLFSHFQKIEVSPEHYIIDWFFSLFTKCLPFTASVRVWDSFLFEGEIFLFQTALAILSMHESELLSSSLEQCVPLLRRGPENTKVEDLYKEIEQVHVPQYIHQFIDRILLSVKKKESKSALKDKEEKVTENEN